MQNIVKTKGNFIRRFCRTDLPGEKGLPILKSSFQDLGFLSARLLTWLGKTLSRLQNVCVFTFSKSSNSAILYPGNYFSYHF